MSKPLQLLSLSLRNFLSFGSATQEIDLSGERSSLILGENVDAARATGAGKSAIYNAICYALYNKPLDNISLQRLINSTNHAKNTAMEVKLTFKKGDDAYEVCRARGAAYGIKIVMNDEDITLDSVSGNDSLVEEIIGISYELFTKVVIFSGNSTPFLMMPVSQQRNQIEELFNITLLSEKAVKLKEIIRSTEGAIAVQEAINKEQEAQLALHDKHLAEAAARVQRWESDRERQLVQLENSLEVLNTVDMNVERELHTLAAEIEKSISPLTSQLTILKRDKSSLTSEVSKLSSELEHLTDEKCPYCLQKFDGAEDKIVEKNQILNQKQDALRSTSEKLDAVIIEKDELSASLSDAKQAMKFGSLAEAIKAETAASTAQQKIDDLINATNPHIEAHEQLKKSAPKVTSYDKLDELKRDLEHQQFMLKLLTDKNSFIRRRIISKTIPFLNRSLSRYTKELGLPHSVKFDDDMSCTVSEYGRELDFGNLSSGEKKQVNLSLSLAFRDVLHHLHSRVNCLFIDEIDGSLDGAGVDSVFKLLKTKSRDENLGLWIISHRPEAIGRFDKTLIVRKEGGFSRIDMETL